MIVTEDVVADPAALPDLDRHVPPGLTWQVPLEARPIRLGRTCPELQLGLDLHAERFWACTRRVAAEAALRDAAMAYALAPDRRRARTDRAALTHALADLNGFEDIP